MFRSKHNFTFNISYSPDKLDKILQKHIGKCNETSKLMGGVTRKCKKWESREPHRCGKQYIGSSGLLQPFCAGLV